MAFYTKKEFSTLCGISSSNLATYISRGKVILSGDLLDDKIELNRDFLEARKSKGQPIHVTPDPIFAAPVIKEPPPRLPAPNIPEPKGNKYSATRGRISDPEERRGGQHSLEREKLQLTNEKLRKDTEKVQIQIDKLNGVLIPTEVARLVVIQLSKSMSTAFKQAADNLLIEFGSMRNLSSHETATIRGKITTITNKAVSDSVADAKKMVENIVEEYSETRGQGEKR